MSCWRRGDRVAAAAANALLLPTALREREHPATMISQRKTILRDRGVLRDAAVRLRATAPSNAVAGIDIDQASTDESSICGAGTHQTH
jgi:hypothetical protein